MSIDTSRGLDAVTYRRSELYEEVWKEPVRTVAKRYGVSDVGIIEKSRVVHTPPLGSRWIRRSALVRLSTMDSIIVIGAA